MKRLLIIFFSIFILSCEEQKYVITEIGDFEVLGTHSLEDKITGPFSLQVRFKTLILANNWNVIPSANAFSKAPIYYVNAINLNSIKVSINKDVKTVDDKVIKAGENLPGYRISGFKNYFNELSDSLIRSDVLNIYYEYEEFQKLKFERGLTKITLTGKNTDNIQFKFEKEVYFDL